ncbi:MAG TPA: hypothetical protein DCE56_38920 [Cyanobacteria bacterium UBA8553]|nr:hypothetical protein [Cyanobacteria bacterium UBA8553]
MGSRELGVGSRESGVGSRESGVGEERFSSNVRVLYFTQACVNPQITSRFHPRLLIHPRAIAN